MTQTLTDLEVKRADVTFYIAYGTHPKQTEKESLNTYGLTYKNYNFVHHDCNKKELFKNLGNTERGTPVLVRRDILESSLIITFGAISHHYFAGYGGGRKLMFPGLGEKNAIYHNHSLFLNKQKNILEPKCQTGRLKENPVAEDLKEIDQASPHKISIYGIPNSRGEICEIYFGETYRDFTNICKIYDKYFKSNIQEKFDLVIASTGGYPKDINLIQSHKSIHNATSFVKDNGHLIILSECKDGVGNDSFLKLFKDKNLFSKLSTKYQGNGGTALALKEKTERINISILTQLSHEHCALMGMNKIEREEIGEIVKRCEGSIAAIQNASTLVR